MTRERTRAVVAQDVYRCCGCDGAAAYEAVYRQVEVEVLTIAGEDKVTQNYRHRYLCAACALDTLDSNDPPMHLVPLDAYKALQERERAKERKAERKAYAAAQSRLGEDWGRRR